MTKCAAPVDPNSIVIPKKPANKSASEHRKITKPIMEKRRRARINQSLEQLKQILIEQFNECSKKSNNLEKADILELTVKHLRDITAKQNQLNQQVVKQQQQPVNTQLAHNNNNQQLNQLLSKQMNHQLTQQQSPVNHKNNELTTFNKSLINRTSSNLNNINNQILTKKGVRLIQDGFKECKQQINECLSQVDKQLNERLNNHLIKFEKQQFEQSKFNCDQVLNLSIHDHLIANNLQAGNLILHTPSSAFSSSSSNVFFPQNSSNGGSLSPGSERSLSPSSDSSSVWRPW